MDYMQRALDIAKLGRYTCAPNPMVGCVIVANGKVVGEGYHKKAGEAHAEVIALQQAGEQAHGATVYLTLEPCCHYGRTPPCVDTLIAAQVAEVVIASIDPNPKVAGKSIERLQDAGIKVTLGQLEHEAKELNQTFFHYITTGLPFVTAKWAMSLDGKTATYTHDSKWITSDVARQHAHQIRQAMDAIIIGSGTVLADDPLLTVRLHEVVHQPLRIVVDARGRCQPTAKIFSAELPDKTLLVTLESVNTKWLKKFTEKNNVEVLQLPATEGSIDLKLLLKELAKRDITSLLVEGGAQLQASFFEQDLVQQIYAYIAPKTIGGEQAPGAIQGVGAANLFDAKQWRFKHIKPLPPDVLLLAERINV
jgi:diaminohydroxyphosphoribosylaminopyrimidine deaminase/5-amino-6-(5-phosphoribosylamino)uracil reductase